MMPINIPFRISPNRFFRMRSINKDKNILIGINNKESIELSSEGLSVITNNIPINKKIKMRIFFFRFTPVEYKIPRMLINEKNRYAAETINTITFKRLSFNC